MDIGDETDEFKLGILGRNQTYHQVQKPVISSIRVDGVNLRYLILI